MTPHNHLYSKYGCSKCAPNYQYTTEEWIEEVKRIHGNKYNYSKVVYIGNKKHVILICNDCGYEWEQTPNCHLRGGGCPKCAGVYQYTTEEWIEEAKKVHGEDEYDYSKVKYEGCETKVILIHKKCGHEFPQTPHSHLGGQGCPYCKKSKFENKAQLYLLEKNVAFIPQHTFKWLKNPETKHNLYLDFYLPDYNIAIECQGIQHFIPIKKFEGEDGYIKTCTRDELKYNLCKEHGIQVIYYSENKKLIPENYYNTIYTNTTDMLNYLYESNNTLDINLEG
jgi:predicted Zn-ribbon and HTH transcriptional regulator